MARSSVLRLGFGERLDELLAAGATIDEIAEDLNAALERGGREERVSRSAVGRATKAREGLLAAKRQQDLLLDALRKDGPGGDATEQRLEMIRILLLNTASQALADPDTPVDVEAAAAVKNLASGFLNVEKAGRLSDQRIAEAEARAKARAGARGEKAARRQGLSAEGAAAIRAAIEGAA